MITLEKLVFERISASSLKIFNPSLSLNKCFMQMSTLKKKTTVMLEKTENLLNPKVYSFL